jgi:mitofusin
VYDLPRAVPRNIGRKLHASLVSPSTDSALQRPDSFVNKQSDRIAATSRSVLRACSYELHKRFVAALEASEEELRAVEASQAEAQTALTWLTSHLESVEAQEAKVEAVDLEERH